MLLIQPHYAEFGFYQPVTNNYYKAIQHVRSMVHGWWCAKWQKVSKVTVLMSKGSLTLAKSMADIQADIDLYCSLPSGEDKFQVPLSPAKLDHHLIEKHD